MNKELREKFDKIESLNKDLNYKQLNKAYPYSVSKIVECFKKPFDAEKMAEHCSKKYKDDPSSKYYNMEPWDILSMWDKAREAGQYSGRCLDDYIGCILMNLNDAANNLYNKQSDDKIKAKFNCFKYLYDNELTKNGFEFGCRELTLWDPVYKWKGRFDAIFVKNDTVILVDWKNNETISTENTYDNLYGPLYKYCASDLNGYTIQLFLYKYALEKYYGFENVKTLLCRIGENDYQFYSPVIEYSEQLVEDILKFAIKELEKKKN